MTTSSASPDARSTDQAARRTILTAHTETLFVEAGAGTGKTTALVARIVDMVATGGLDDIAHLAAITFTENAAAELRSRLREGLAGAARGEHRGTTYSAEQQSRARAALTRFDDAAVTTIHGFAARLLAEAPLEADLPPGFVVRDPIAAQVEQSHAWRRFLDDLLADDGPAEHVRAGLTLGLTPAALEDVATAFAGSWDLLTDRPFRPVPLPHVDVAPIVAALRAATTDADRWPDDGLACHLRTVVVPTIATLETATDDDDRLAALAERGLTCGRGAAGAWRKAGLSKPAIVALLSQAESARAHLVTAVGHAVTTTLAARVQEHVLTETERRRSSGRVDFHDLLVFARDLLRDDGARTLLRERWRVIMVDEFQDTDPLQVEIVDLLAADRPRFYVGDPKQSIYRFRRADVTLYEHVGAENRDARVSLAVNFRSVPGILDAVNHVFRELLGGGSITYADLLGNRPAPAAGADAGPAVTILGGPDDGTGGDADDRRRREAEHLADVLVRAHEGWSIEGADRVSRHPSFADMAVLLPTRISLPALESALQGRDLPYRIESRSLVWSSDAVRDLVTILSAIDNPADQVATVAALRHPGLACSDVDLAEWAAAGGSWTYLAPFPVGLDEHPVAAGMSTLRRMHDLRWWLPVHELVALVVRDLRLVELTADLRRPRDHWRRLRFVVDQARAFTDAGGSGLGAFVAWALIQEESGADVLETAVPEPDDDAIRILTIHGAKGLEFPVAAVAGLGGTGGGDVKVLWDRGGEAQVRFRATTLETAGWTGALAREKEVAGDEALRVLYVAMTRAKDHLILGCYHKPTAKEPSKSHAQRLVELLPEDGGLARVEPQVEGGAAVPRPQQASPAPAVCAGGRATFDADRAALLAGVAARTATTPTALVAAPAPDGAAPDNPLSTGPDAAGATAARESGGRRRRPGRRSAALGTAVHRVLELAEPGDPDEVIGRLATLACEENNIPDLADDVAGRVRGVLAGPVGEALATGTAWREVYLVVPDGQRLVEGYVDLLVDDGTALTVLDYKTDRVTGDEDRAARRSHYAPQVAEYARMVRAVTGRTPRTDLVFLPPTRL